MYDDRSAFCRRHWQTAWVTYVFSSTKYPSLLGRQKQNRMRSILSTMGSLMWGIHVPGSGNTSIYDRIACYNLVPVHLCVWCIISDMCDACGNSPSIHPSIRVVIHPVRCVIADNAVAADKPGHMDSKPYPLVNKLWLDAFVPVLFALVCFYACYRSSHFWLISVDHHFRYEPKLLVCRSQNYFYFPPLVCL